MKVRLAQAIDPDVVTAVQGVFGDVQGFVVTVIAVALFALIAAVLGIKLGARWMQKAGRSAG